MTIENEDTIILYTGDGVTTSYTYNFRVDAQADMSVFLDSVEQASGWSITGLQNPTGGNVIFDTPPGVGAFITLVRVIDIHQKVDYKPYDPFPAETHEFALDKLTMIAQQLKKDMQGAFRLPQYLDPSLYTMEIYPVADNYIKWNSDATGIENSPDPNVIDRLYYNNDIGELRVVATNYGAEIFPDDAEVDRTGILSLHGPGVYENWFIGAFQDRFSIYSDNVTALTARVGAETILNFANQERIKTSSLGAQVCGGPGTPSQGGQLFVCIDDPYLDWALDVYENIFRIYAGAKTYLLATADDAVQINHDGAEAIKTVDNGADFGSTMRVDNTGIKNVVNGSILEIAGFASNAAPRSYLSLNPDGRSQWKYNNNEVLGIEDGEIVVGNINANATINLYNPVATGAWRIRIEGSDLVFQRREIGTWVTKQTISA